MSRHKIERFLKRVLHKALDGIVDENLWKIDIAIKNYAKYYQDSFYNEQKHINELGYPLDAVMKDINGMLKTHKEGSSISLLNAIKAALLFEKDNYWIIEYREIPLYHYFRFYLPSHWGLLAMYDPERSPIRVNIEKILELKREKDGSNTARQK